MFNERLLPEKENFSSNLNIENIADAYYIPLKRAYKDFQVKSLGEYYDLYLKSDSLILADIFENFQKICLKIYHLNSTKFILAPGLAL